MKAAVLYAGNAVTANAIKGDYLDKRMIAPVIITVLLLLYFVAFGALWMALEDGMPLIVTIMGLSIPAICIVASVYVLIERIKEIRSGVEDDLDKY